MNPQNTLRLLGTVGTEPQIFIFDNGTKLAKLGLSTKERLKDKNGNYFFKKKFYHLSIWNKGADLVHTYVKQKAKLAIVGTLSFVKYIDEHNNEDIREEILIKDFSMLGNKEEAVLLQVD
jgi:single-strand DNA-binding protein